MVNEITASFKANKKELDNILDKNCFLGGSAALNLMGVKIRRAVLDIDIVIFKPSSYQKEYCQKNLQSCSGYGEDIESLATIFRFEKNGSLSINLLLCDNETPTRNLYIVIESVKIFLNSFENILKAKKYYINKSSSTVTVEKHRKDIDFIFANFI